MDSQTLVDYALFQLTPTRTRCDLVVFSGRKSEKLASGLVEPFASHLKFAKDQILKGGYSITLRPPTGDAFWFTKHTFQRFVRFVSTPEILERFIQIEGEILQIASSIQSNEIPSSNSLVNEEKGSLLPVDGVTKKTINSNKSNGKARVADGAASEENSKLHLQKLLGTRKSLLLKEQAMAFARAKAAGYEMDRMDDLIYFADAFGASRLRKACADFRDLYQKKHTDSQWMDELAAMEAYSANELSYLGSSAITLAFENNNSSSQGSGSSNIGANGANPDTTGDKDMTTSHQVPEKIQSNMPWPSHQGYPQNFHVPIQQYPPYLGYPMSGMHPVPPYYPGQVDWRNPVSWPSAGSHKKSKRKEKYLNAEGPRTAEHDEQSESNNSISGTDTETDEDEKSSKKPSPSGEPYVRKNRKSSKTVVIRNINYITSKRRNRESDSVSDASPSDEASITDEDAIRKDVEHAVLSLGQHRHSKGNKSKNERNRGSKIQSECGDCTDNAAADTSEDGQTNENWNTFQSLIMNHEESFPRGVSEKIAHDFEDHFPVKSTQDEIFLTSGPGANLEYENVKVHHLTNDVSLVMTERDGSKSGQINTIDIGNIEEKHPNMKRRAPEDVQLLLSQNLQGSGSGVLDVVSDFSANSSSIRPGAREDWFIVNRSVDVESQESKKTILHDINGFSSEQDRYQLEESKRISIDDSLMIQSRVAVDDQQDSEWRTDISMLADLTMGSTSLNSTPDVSSKVVVLGKLQPDDLCVVLERDSVMESSEPWTQGVDYGIEVSFSEAERTSSVVERHDLKEETHDMVSKRLNGKKAVGPTKSFGKEMRSKVPQGSLLRSKENSMLNSKKTSSGSRWMAHKSKLEKEEEVRKRMEELVIQRQKRIAERTAASGASKSLSSESKNSTAKLERHRAQSVPKTITAKSVKDSRTKPFDQLKKTSWRVSTFANA